MVGNAIIALAGIVLFGFTGIVLHTMFRDPEGMEPNDWVASGIALALALCSLTALAMGLVWPTGVFMLVLGALVIWVARDRPHHALAATAGAVIFALGVGALLA